MCPHGCQMHVDDSQRIHSGNDSDYSATGSRPDTGCLTRHTPLPLGP
jgi:hypothetical protein